MMRRMATTPCSRCMLLGTARRCAVRPCRSAPAVVGWCGASARAGPRPGCDGVRAAGAGVRAAVGRCADRARAPMRPSHCTLTSPADPARRRAVVGGIDFDAAIQVHRAFAELVVAERLQGSGSSAGFSSANMAATCRLVVPWMRVSAQRCFPVVQVSLGFLESSRSAGPSAECSWRVRRRAPLCPCLSHRMQVVWAPPRADSA